MPTTQDRLERKSPPIPGLRGRREGLLEKEGSEEGLKGFNGRGAERATSAEGKEQRKKRRAMPSKEGLSLSRGSGRGGGAGAARLLWGLGIRRLPRPE